MLPFTILVAGVDLNRLGSRAHGGPGPEGGTVLRQVGVIRLIVAQHQRVYNTVGS
jgi:hypothetical protein